jgi:hypothetical protein
MGKRKQVLEYSRWDLTDTQFEWFGEHGLQGIDYKSCSMSPEDLADADSCILPIGVELDEEGCIPADAFDTYKGYPKSFWKELELPKAIQKEIEAFWTENPEGEVRWEG